MSTTFRALSLALLAAFPLEAFSRAGGGRSMGVSRSSSYSRPAPSYSRPSTPPPRYTPPPAPVKPYVKPRSNTSAVVAGAAAGAGTYMLLNSGNSQAAEEIEDPMIPCRYGYERERYDNRGICVVD